MLTKSPMLDRCGSPAPLFTANIHKCIIKGMEFGIMVGTAFVVAWLVIGWVS